MALERRFKIVPGYDDGSNGRHGCDLIMVVRGKRNAVQFVLYTGWLPDGSVHPPMGADVGYHASEPQWDGDEPLDDDCKYTGGICHYDGSGIRAQAWFRDHLLTGGSDAIWELLEADYREMFGDE